MDCPSAGPVHALSLWAANDDLLVGGRLGLVHWHGTENRWRSFSRTTMQSVSTKSAAADDVDDILVGPDEL